MSILFGFCWEKQIFFLIKGNFGLQSFQTKFWFQRQHWSTHLLFKITSHASSVTICTVQATIHTIIIWIGTHIFSTWHQLLYDQVICVCNRSNVGPGHQTPFWIPIFLAYIIKYLKKLHRGWVIGHPQATANEKWKSVGQIWMEFNYYLPNHTRLK